MKAFRTALTSLSLLLVTFSVSVTTIADDGLSVEQARLKAHIDFLASDALLGRAAGSREFEIAARYVASQFEQLGMRPAGTDGSFFQEVPLVERQLVEGSGSVTVAKNGQSYALTYGDDFLMPPDGMVETQSVAAEAVFVGYGIVAPEFGHDDYADVDVEGKIVVMLTGRPEAWPTEEGAHFASGREKARHAAERGAVGRVIIATPRTQDVFSWDLYRYYYTLSSMSWVDEAGVPDGYHKVLKGAAVVHSDKAADMFDGTPMSAQDVFDADANGGVMQSFDLPVSFSLSRESAFERMTSPNILAAIPGSDPKLSDEYVVFTAHLDHLGVVEGEDGEDHIYNGALDNAAGVSMLLETARILSAERDQLRRSVLFLVVTAEEKGLLGAGYFAKQPTVPIDQLVANVNLDMPVVLYPFADMVAFGAEHSSLKDVVARAASQAGIELSPDYAPEQGYFTRSDHYKLVQEGVPAVALDVGFKSKDPSIDGEAIAREFTNAHYHKPSDEASLPIDYDAAAVFAEININIAREICNADERPTWNKGDFFGETFGPDRVAD